MARTSTTYSAVAIAREASKGRKSPVTDKQVRGLARDVLARFSKATHPAYQSHAYTASERTTLLRLFAERASGRSSKAASKAATVTRKRARTAKVAAQTAPVTSDA